MASRDRAASLRILSASFLVALTSHLSPLTSHPAAEAAVSKANDKQLQAASTNQGGGTITSGSFRQQISVGEPVSGNRLSSSRFTIVPGFLGATLSATQPSQNLSLDLSVLYAKTDPLGPRILPQTWQRVNTPIFIWEPPTEGTVAGYSYAIDAAPDNLIDTTDTSLNVATSSLKQLTDGKRTFTVKAVNSAGNAGRPISFELWVDTTPPQISVYAPSPGTLLNMRNASVSATVVDAGSGVDPAATTLLINGGAVPVTFDPVKNLLTSSGSGAWKEGANSVELRLADAVGNVQAPLVWSVTMDTTPPTGTVMINGGAAMTTSVYVTLTLTASDAVSGVDRMLLSNEETTGYVEEPFMPTRELWKLNAVRGTQHVYVKFRDRAGNVSKPVSAQLELGLLAPETVITSGPAGYTPSRSATFTFMCPEGSCVFSYAFDGDKWSDWGPATSITKADLAFGNHYFRVKAAKEVNGTPGIQPDEEDPTPAERTWVVGVEAPVFTAPKGSPIKLWRIE